MDTPLQNTQQSSGELVTVLPDLQTQKLELEVAALKSNLEGKKKEPPAIENHPLRIIAFAGGALVFSGTVLSSLRPPLVGQPLLVAFYVLSILSVLSAGFATLVRQPPFLKLTYSAVAASVWTLVASIVILAIFVTFNYQDDWKEPSVITDISADKTLVKPSEAVKLEANIKNPNQKNIQYRWTASSGRLLDSEGNKVAWLAPSETGEATIRLSLISPDTNEATSTEAIKLNVQSSLETPEEQTIAEFTKRCTEALDKAYDGKLVSHVQAYASATMLCSSAGIAEEGVRTLDEAFLLKQAQELVKATPVDALPKYVASTTPPKGASFWDRRPCCSEYLILWPFCKIWSPDCK